jgi:hypothetical protein
MPVVIVITMPMPRITVARVMAVVVFVVRTSFLQLLAFTIVVVMRMGPVGAFIGRTLPVFTATALIKKTQKDYKAGYCPKVTE